MELFACQIVNDDVVTVEYFDENSDAFFGSIQILSGLNKIAIAVRLQFENVKRSWQREAPTTYSVVGRG